MKEILLCILGGGLGTALINIISLSLQRKWSKDDVTTKALKALLIDRVTYLVKHHMRSHSISLNEKNNLEEMHVVYKELGGNGHLDAVMGELEKIPVEED